MDLSILIIILFFLLTLALLILFLTTRADKIRLQEEYILLKREIGNQYVNKKDVRILNAVQEAYEYAKQNNKDFEIKEYKSLIQELKGKWG